MTQNSYLGSCLGVVYRPTKGEIEKDSLQAPYVLLLLKSRLALDELITIERLRAGSVFDPAAPVMLRIGSECLFGVFGDAHCDCESQRVRCLREISRQGQGVYVHLPQEAQGRGLYYKAKELQLQVSGVSPDGRFVGQQSVVDAARWILGSSEALDVRGYSAIGRIFQETGLDRYSYDLIGGNPQKCAFLQERLGLRVAGSIESGGAITIENVGEYIAKLYSKGFVLTDAELEEICILLYAAPEIPGRVLGLLGYLREDMAHGRDFKAQADLLGKIARVAEERGLNHRHVDELDLLRDAAAYEEFQVELLVNDEDVARLFAAGVLSGITSLRYEENHFYDLAYFKHVPARSLKVRYAYKVRNRDKPTEIKFIYKVPTRDRTYRIRAVSVPEEEVARLLDAVLRDYERHRVAVFTHSVETAEERAVVLLKRYTKAMRALSLMGPEEIVRRLVDEVRRHAEGREIEDPSNYRYIDRKLVLDFNYDQLVDDELELFRRYAVG